MQRLSAGFHKMIIILEVCSLTADTDLSQNVIITSCLMSNVVHVLPGPLWLCLL